MSTSKKDVVQKAKDYITKFRQEWDASNAKFRQEEEKFYNDNKDGSLKGWIYIKDPNSAWGGTWSKTKPISTTKVASNSEVVSKPVTTPTKTTKPVVEESAFDKKYGGIGYKKVYTKDKNDYVYRDPSTNYDYYKSGRVRNGQYWGTVNGDNIKWDNVTTVSNTAYRAPTKTIWNGFFTDYVPNNDHDLVQLRNDLISNNKNLRNYHHWNYTTGFLGDQEYPMVVTTGLGSDNPHNDRSYYYNPQTQMYALIDEDWQGKPKGAAAVGNKVLWYTWDDIKRGVTFADHKKFFKQGGTMNRINYFQQGGAAPQQQDMQQQIIALVQAAMQGDQKATQTVNQIMEAAKAGDQQAMQLAQMIQQIAKQMQGQATTAKWGAKLGYIRSLKFANGGKACPTCQAGAPIKPIKKVEEKACGGKAKKAKKRYFGGWL